MSKKIVLSVSVLADLDATVRAKVEGKYGDTESVIATESGIIQVGRCGEHITFKMDGVGDFQFSADDTLTGHGIVDYINSLFEEDSANIMVPLAGVKLEDGTYEIGVVLRATEKCMYVYLNNRRLLVFDRRTGEVRKGLCHYEGNALKCSISLIDEVNKCFNQLNAAGTLRVFSPEQPLVDSVYDFVKECGVIVFDTYYSLDGE